jgi:hypothetical protein
MTPSRLFLLSILCLVFAGVLLFSAPPSMLMSILAGLATLFALTTYFIAIYLRRAGDRGEQAHVDLRERIAQATEQEIQEEHRLYHRGGFSGVTQGDMVIFYRTAAGWLMVPLLEELAWVEIPHDKVESASLIGEAGGVTLQLEFETAAGQEMRVDLGSGLHAPRQQTRENVGDLLALRAAMTTRDGTAAR